MTSVVSFLFVEFSGIFLWQFRGIGCSFLTLFVSFPFLVLECGLFFFGGGVFCCMVVYVWCVLRFSVCCLGCGVSGWFLQRR